VSTDESYRNYQNALARRAMREHPHQCDLDAGGNCRHGCGFNSDVEHYAAIDRGEDVYGYVPDSEPVPVPDRVLLPAPDGVDVHGVVAHWRVSSGEWLFAQPGHVFGALSLSLDQIEQDALAALAACAWARR
jgi:hypothetical protein